MGTSTNNHSPLGAVADAAFSKYRHLFRTILHRETGAAVRQHLELVHGLHLDHTEDVSLGEAYVTAYARLLEATPAHVLPNPTADDVLREYWRIVATPRDYVVQT